MSLDDIVTGEALGPGGVLSALRRQFQLASDLAYDLDSGQERAHYVSLSEMLGSLIHSIEQKPDRDLSEARLILVAVSKTLGILDAPADVAGTDSLVQPTAIDFNKVRMGSLFCLVKPDLSSLSLVTLVRVTRMHVYFSNGARVRVPFGVYAPSSPSGVDPDLFILSKDHPQVADLTTYVSNAEIPGHCQEG